MGKGDKKTRRGKIWRGTFGKRRPYKPRKSKPAAKVAR
jgi:30S ribosomal protein S31